MAWKPVRRERHGPPRRGVGGFLAGLRIRKKLVFLHTCFSLVLAGVLALALRPAVGEVVRQAEEHEAMVVLDVVLAEHARAATQGGDAEEALRVLRARLGGSVAIKSGTAEALGLDTREAGRIRALAYGTPARRTDGAPVAAAYDPAADRYLTVSVVLSGAREAVTDLYLLVTAALLAVYGLVALALELFVLPEHVYGPIQSMLKADRALREGRVEDEVIPDEAMPADELGEIMESRNQSILSLRRHEAELAHALARLEEVANDLRRKNHLLEMARRNLADADRLASLGMMSAGLAHELNTPLAVLKGMVEKLNGPEAQPGDGAHDAPAGRWVPQGDAALMLRVVGRLERLSESLLDFARVRPHRSRSVALHPLADEAWTLVRLDREARGIAFENHLPGALTAWGDPDRLTQVLVNLLRNAADAMSSGPSGPGREAPSLRVEGERIVKDGRPWASVRIRDNGPGIPPEMLARMFQPFVSSRLDAKGTGLGLAVSEGIIREHGGVILARNRADRSGAEFEILLPEADGTAAASIGDSAPISAPSSAGRAAPLDSRTLPSS